MGRVCSTYDGAEEGIQSFVRKPEAKQSLGRPVHRWTDGIKVDLR
jgi:hypothetical protein